MDYPDSLAIEKSGRDNEVEKEPICNNTAEVAGRKRNIESMYLERR